MALRKILTKGDEQLAKHCRPVEKFDDRLHVLIDDMRETLENSGGVGLAAPQKGSPPPKKPYLHADFKDGQNALILQRSAPSSSLILA